MRKIVQNREFQSTLPVWGGTGIPRRPGLTHQISIHPPRVGRDIRDAIAAFVPEYISIHPPRVGRDARRNVPKLGCSNFNPPSPCGEGRVSRRWTGPDREFQSTLPVWGGTV